MLSLPRRDRDAAHRAELLDVLFERAGVGLWDAVFHQGDATHPLARWTWSPEFRRLCGFTNEASFPDRMESWSDRLHPDDAGPTFATFNDAVGRCGLYDVTYRLKVADGSWQWFRATGGMVADASGKARRACGSLVSIQAQMLAEEQRKAIAADIAQDFRKEVLGIVGEVAAATGHLERDAAALGAATARTEMQSVCITAASKTASGEMQGVAAATAQMTISVQDIARRIAHAVQIASEAAGQTHSANNVANGLLQDVQRIGDVVKLIANVAAQTNLLALNATIEAARAGEAGKGFAVVASEVKSLAQQTARATEDINTRIGAVQSATANVTRAIGQVSETVARINETATVMSSAVQEQTVATGEIAGSLQRTSNEFKTMSASMDGVNGSVAKSGLSAARINAASRALSGQAAGLTVRVEGFLERLKTIR